MEAEVMELKNTVLGIELGSTRIKAVLLNERHIPVAAGSHEWENQLVNGVWTYSMDAIHGGLQACYADLKRDVKEKFGVTLTTVGAIGVSAMMHGYLPFDRDGKQLAEFRTWRNTMTGEAAEKLSALFNFNIPQRWSIAHLYQAILNGEKHVKDIAQLTTLANFMRTHLLSALATLKIGLDILTGEENVQVDKLYGHGGFFKTPGVGQKLLSAAVNAPVSVMETAGEGGPYGMALLCAYMLWKDEGESLPDYLDNKVFYGAKSSTVMADKADIDGFNKFLAAYKAAFPVEKTAVEVF